MYLPTSTEPITVLLSPKSGYATVLPLGAITLSSGPNGFTVTEWAEKPLNDPLADRIVERYVASVNAELIKGF